MDVDHGQRLLVEVGQTHYFQPNTMGTSPASGRTPSRQAGNDVSRVDRDLGTISRSPAATGRSVPERYSWQGSMSYVTGAITSRSEATGTGAGNGPIRSRSRISSRNTGPAYPTPCWCAIRRSLRGRQDDRRRGLFAQDSWTHKRLTVTGGLRFEYFDARIPEQSSPAGRFVGERQFDAIDHVPQFSNLVPRLSAA